MLFSIFMIVALSTQVYASHNNGNTDESDFQKIQCYEEITPERPNFVLRAQLNPTKYYNHNFFKLDYEFRYIALNEFIELGDYPWNQLTFNKLTSDEKLKIYGGLLYQNIVPDYLAFRTSRAIKDDAEPVMWHAQHCLENITELLAEKKSLHGIIESDTELDTILDLIELKIIAMLAEES